MAIEVGLGQAPLNNGPTVDFTSATLTAAPKAVFALVGDGGTNGAPNGDWRMGLGVTDGTEDHCFAVLSQVSQSTTRVERVAEAIACRRRAINLSADKLAHNSFLTDGWRADHTDTGGFGKLALAAMFGGSDVVAEAGVVTLNGTSAHTVTLANSALTPNVILFGTTAGAEGSATHSFFLPSLGIAVDDGATLAQRAWMMRHDDALSTTSPHAIISSTQCVGAKDDWAATLNSVAAGEFTLTPDSDPGGVDVWYLALQLSNANLALIDTDTPVSTGLHEETAPSFQPKFVLQVGTLLTALDTAANDATAGAVSLNLFNATEAYSYSWAEEYGASTTNNQSLTAAQALLCPDDAGATLFDATFSQFTANGYELDYAATDGTARKGFALVIGEATGGVAASGSPQAQSATAAGSGDQTLSGTGTPQAQTATAAGTGSGEQTFTGSGAPQAQTATASGPGDQTLFGAGTPQAQGASTAGAAIQTLAGTGAPQAQGAVTVGIGAEATGASGTPASQAATAAGTGTAAKVTSAVLAAQAANTAGAGVQTIGGSGALAAQAASALGVNGGTDSVTASASLAAQAAALAGPGLQSPFGRGPLAAQTALLAGGGRQVIHGLAATDIANRPTAQSAVLAGSGFAAIPTSSATGSGAMQAQAATLAAAVENRGPGFGTTHTGRGSLRAEFAAGSGTGTVEGHNRATLVADQARLTGKGVGGRAGGATSLSSQPARLNASVLVLDGTLEEGSATLVANPNTIAEDATSLLILTTRPHRGVLWQLSGPGYVTPLTLYTNDAGLAYALYHPGLPGTTVTIRAIYGGE